MNYSDLLKKVEVLKVSKTRFSDVKMYFSGNSIFAAGIFNGVLRGCDSENKISVFIATDKGYESSEWKKSEFYKMGKVELTEELFNKLLPFIQNDSPKLFFKKTGISVASALANHINSKVDYNSNKTLR